eukprot:GEMP01022902.1.p1 GENE.GEMP01022902.1~~GEMP01022902.1.p1  ORF type:complete len:493 (+),score=116.87 GEMP01022902.1:106-1584(+)
MNAALFSRWWSRSELLRSAHKFNWGVLTVQRRWARVLVVHPKFLHVSEEEAEWDEEEARLLCSALHEIEVFPTLRIEVLDHRWALRQGDIKRILTTLVEKSCDQLFVNTTLNPTQQHHLELAVSLITKFTSRPTPPIVIDRRRLVLDIFIQKSPSKSARLQAQLVDLQLQKTPLLTQNKALGPLQGLADHLSRSIGAVGGRAGGQSASARNLHFSFQSDPQITKMKAKRVLDEKEKKLKAEIETLAKNREVHRRGRTGVPTVGIVGYTNVGKSALVNALTNAELDVKDQLFATTSTAFRSMGTESAIVMDTVGFIKDLPCELFEAFRATMEEMNHSSLILHVRDISSPGTDLMLRTVNDALQDVDKPVWEVWNKIDLLDESERRYLLTERAKRGDVPPLLVSCLTGEGIEELERKIKDVIGDTAPVTTVPGKKKRVAIEVDSLEVTLPLPLDPPAWTFLHKHAKIMQTHDEHIEVQFPNVKTKAQYQKLFGL